MSQTSPKKRGPEVKYNNKHKNDVVRSIREGKITQAAAAKLLKVARSTVNYWMKQSELLAEASRSRPNAFQTKQRKSGVVDVEFDAALFIDF